MPLADPRMATILRLMGAGWSAVAIAGHLGINRKTIGRWRASLTSFREATDRVTELARVDTPEAREQIEGIVGEWESAAVSMVRVTLAPVPVSAPAEVPCPVEAPSPVEVPSHTAEPDVLARDGRLLVRSPEPVLPSSPPDDDVYTRKRPPTQAEWVAEMTAVALDPNAPERLRAVAMTCVSNALFVVPERRVPVRQSESTPSPAAEAAEREAREKGRDAGVPASFWQDARMKFLGPAPQPAVAGKDESEPVPAESSSA